MPWKERSVMEERMRFVLRLKDGERMASLCREFGISRVTGYKIYERYKECGLQGLTDRARTPYRYANKLPAQIEAMIVAMRREKPTWGARKLRERLLRKLPNCLASAENGEKRSSVNIDGEDACEKNESTTRQKKRSAS